MSYPVHRPETMTSRSGFTSLMAASAARVATFQSLSMSSLWPHVIMVPSWSCDGGIRGQGGELPVTFDVVALAPCDYGAVLVVYLVPYVDAHHQGLDRYLLARVVRDANQSDVG